MKKNITLFILMILLYKIDGFSQITNVRTVVHVMYTSPSENISDATVISYIDQVNKGYSKMMPSKFVRTPDVFGSDWTNTKIQFCLANSDPDGNPTNGITHTQISDKFITSQNPASPSNPVWNPVNYLNIYLVPVFSEPGFPNFVLGGWASTPTSPQMGATFNYVVVSTNGISFIPELLCHEIGHVLGLEHLDIDNIADTPKGIETISPNPGYASNCSLTLQTQNSSNLAQDGNHWGGIDPPDMIENFMGLTFSCQFMFTNLQGSLMTNYLNTHNSSWITTNCTGPNSLAEISAIKELNLFYPNPVGNVFYISDINSEIFSFVEITDTDGKIILRQENLESKKGIDVSDLQSGIYICKYSVKGKSTVVVSKLIKL